MYLSRTWSVQIEVPNGSKTVNCSVSKVYYSTVWKCKFMLKNT